MSIDYNELFIKYERLQDDYRRLQAENTALKSQLCIYKTQNSPLPALISPEKNSHLVDYKSAPEKKVALFSSLFIGRTDVFATRWQNKQGKSGYTPACQNEWKRGICQKPNVTCSRCNNKLYHTFNNSVISDHLSGKIIAGIYPLKPDETCHLLAIDFDGENWTKDVSAIREVCNSFKIPIAVERSRSGNGAHVWFFFEEKILSTNARKFGSALLSNAMNNRHDLSFKSYDRFFPNQETMPKGGFGNLIALPLQKQARLQHNSEFIDENFVHFSDQWAFLSSITRLSLIAIESLTKQLCSGNELGILKCDSEEAQKPWEPKNSLPLTSDDFPKQISIIISNMLFIPKSGISQRGLNHLKRLAAFKNPDFFKAQAMRLSTYNKPRIISCADETDDYICLPRGCREDLSALLNSFEIVSEFIDQTQKGNYIDVSFNGVLREEQTNALRQLSNSNTGVLCGTTAFGKTVVAISLIADKKVNTLILVDKISLLSQWEKRLQEFLTIRTSPQCTPDTGLKIRGRRKVSKTIGQIGADKNTANGIIDIALFQSLNKSGEVMECIKQYGMIIIDECHHVSAFTFETVLKAATSKYVYGLTATPTRKDGHHPIIFMQCGSIQYRDDAKKQADKRPFSHFVIPRFTSLKIPDDKSSADPNINTLYAEVLNNEFRNQMILSDIIKCHSQGRNCLILTERKAHVELLFSKIKTAIPDVLTLTGGKSISETRTLLKTVSETPSDKLLTIIATGKFIGEGFDEPRLDTLFLTMPISWKGTLQQYAGRLHRLYDTKKEVRIFDYIDIHVKMLERMYQKRLNGYASIGYKVKGSINEDTLTDYIFDKNSFLPVYRNDIINAVSEIMIISPFVRKNRVLQVVDYWKNNLHQNVNMTIITRPINDFKEADQPAINDTLSFLKISGVKTLFRSNIHQKFAIIDNRIVWYGSINLLSFGNAEESIMRLENSFIAKELKESI